MSEQLTRTFAVLVYLGVVHEELLGQHVPAGVRVQVRVFVHQPGDDVNMNSRVEMLQLLCNIFYHHVFF